MHSIPLFINKHTFPALRDMYAGRKNVLPLSHPVAPGRDSVLVLKNYADAKGVQCNKWKLLTGSKGEIYNPGRKFYYDEEDLGVDSDTSIFLHTENFVFIDKNRHIRCIYNCLDPNSMVSLKNDIIALKKAD